MSDSLRVDDRTTIPAGDLVWTAVRASGPGGQNVNKVASKVELRFDLAGCGVLAADVKARLRALAGTSRLDADGRIIIVSQRTRDRERNLADARERLRLLIVRALVPPTPRRPTKPSRASRQRRLADKKRHGEKKRARTGGRGGGEEG